MGVQENKGESGGVVCEDDDDEEEELDFEKFVLYIIGFRISRGTMSSSNPCELMATLGGFISFINMVAGCWSRQTSLMLSSVSLLGGCCAPNPKLNLLNFFVGGSGFSDWPNMKNGYM